MRAFGTPDGSGHNSPRGVSIDFDKMEVFDSLPAPIRRALAHAPRSYNPKQVRDHWLRTGLSPEEYVETVMPAHIAKRLELRP